MLTGSLALHGLVACGGAPGGEGGGDKPLAGEVKRREAPRVRVTPVEQREMVRVLSTTQAIQSEREVPILPRIGGIVTELLVEEGMRVEADAPLARIDPRDADAALADAEVALKEVQNQIPLKALAVKEASEQIERAKLAHEQAVRDVERNERAGLISENELEKLRTARDQAARDLQSAVLAHERSLADEAGQDAALDRAKLAVELQRLNLSYTEIRAPFPGVIATRNIQVGNTASAAEPAFVITDPDSLQVVIFRPQKELAFFAGAQAGGDETSIDITAYPDALPGEAYAGDIRFVSPTIDPTSGSFRVTVDLEQPEVGSDRPRLLPGMLVRLAIITERHPDALVVPKRALRREGDRHFLFAVRDERAFRVDVLEGLSDDEFVEVTPREDATLSEGDVVVVVGNRDLEDGQEVQIEEERDEAEETPEEDPPAEGGVADEGPAEAAQNGDTEAEAEAAVDPETEAASEPEDPSGEASSAGEQG